MQTLSTPNVTNIWSNCLKEIKQVINDQSFQTWFQPIKPVKFENSVLTIEVPSQFFYEWLEENYVGVLSQAIKSELGSSASLEYQILVDKPRQNSDIGQLPNNEGEYTSSKHLNNASGTSFNPESIKNPFVIPGVKRLNVESQLNSSYTFDYYVEGECNQLARSAGLAISDNPGGTSFNPLVIYGGVGLGKTHLAQAVGNKVKGKNSDHQVLYLSSEKFTNQFIESVKTNSIADFNNFFQMIDVLIVDDIQFFADKDRTQDIFFHIFNNLHQSGKQIILTSDRAPKDLPGMEERLLSRFKWGLITDLQKPDYETRLAILQMKMQQEGVELPNDVVEYVAFNIKSNIRELEGVMISLLAQASLTRREIDLPLAKKIVKSFVNNFNQEISFDSIQQTVSETLGISIELIQGKSRKREIVQARQIAMYFCKELTDSSLKNIGSAFGGRDHSTVIHACQTVRDLMDTDRNFERQVAEVEKKLRLSIGG